MGPLPGSLDVNLGSEGFMWMLTSSYRRGDAIARRIGHLTTHLSTLLKDGIEAEKIPKVCTTLHGVVWHGLCMHVTLTVGGGALSGSVLWR